MAKINGSAGKAELSGGATTLITGWTMDIAGDTINVTDSGDTTWEEFIASGFTGFTGTFEGFQETNTNDLTVGDTAAELVLKMDGSRNYTGDVIITNCGTVCDVPGAEAIKKSYTFQGTGTLNLTNA